MKLKSIFNHLEMIKYSSLIFLSNFVGALILFISNLMLSKHLGPEIFGNFKTVLGLSLFLPTLIEFGAGFTLVKYIAEFKQKEKINHLIRSILKLRIFSYLILIILVFVFRDQIAFFILKDISLSYLIVPSIVITSLFFFEIFKSISLGFQEYKDYSISKLLTFASQGIFILVFGYFFGIYYALIGWGLSYLVGNFLLIKSIIKKQVLHNFGKFDVKKILMRYSLPMQVLYFLQVLSFVAIPILSLYFSQKIIGFYSFAMIFYNGVVLIPFSLSDYLIPKISELNGKKSKKEIEGKLKSVILLYSFVVVPSLILTIIFSDYFVNLIAPSYMPGILVFKTLIGLGLLNGYFMIYSSYLRAVAELKKFALIVLIQDIIFFVISFQVLSFLS